MSRARARDFKIWTVKASDLQNLNTGEAICRVGRSEADFNLIVPEPETLLEESVTFEARD